MAVRKVKDNDSSPEEISFKFRGVDLVMPIGGDLPLDALEAFEDNKVTRFIALALGEAQWNKIRALKLKLSDLSELVKVIADAMGTTPGE